MEALAALNGITNPDRIEVGQVLRIPSRDRSMRRPRGGARRRAPAIEFVPYSVLPGDTLRNVATAQGVTVEALAAANEVHLAPGQLLAIPRG
jgi:LysM repeat protein